MGRLGNYAVGDPDATQILDQKMTAVSMRPKRYSNTASTAFETQGATPLKRLESMRMEPLEVELSNNDIAYSRGRRRVSTANGRNKNKQHNRHNS